MEAYLYPTDDGGLAVSWKDISPRKRAEHALQFLNEASTILASSLDFEATLSAVARLAVPRLGDWCGIEIVGEDGTARQLAVAHADPAKIPLAHELRTRYPADPAAPNGLPLVLRTGATEFYPEISSEQIAASAIDADHLELLRKLELHSVIIVPLTARDRILGALTLIGAESGRRFTIEDVGIAESLARRAALAVDNARLYRDAERARADAEAANQAKSDFLATMSHELRTPLNAIAGYTELLEMELRGPITGEQREDLRRIRRSQRHLLALVNDVLNFARLDTGHLHYDIATVPVVDALVEVEAMVAPQLQAKGLSYELSSPSRELSVVADREKLQQIMVNLLSNALKFTATGGRITVACSASQRSVSIAVIDTGRGIPDDKLEVIFEPFVQVERALTRETEGSGLGLAISRQLARAMSGELTVTSELGAGSTFTLTLPRGPLA
jgi:signal transduction histidine kinase